MARLIGTLLLLYEFQSLFFLIKAVFIYSSQGRNTVTDLSRFTVSARGAGLIGLYGQSRLLIQSDSIGELRCNML